MAERLEVLEFVLAVGVPLPRCLVVDVGRGRRRPGVLTERVGAKGLLLEDQGAHRTPLGTGVELRVGPTRGRRLDAQAGEAGLS